MTAPTEPRRHLMELTGRIPVAMVAACPFPANRGTPIRIQQMGEALDRIGFDVHVVTYHLGEDRPTPGLTIHRIRSLVPYQEFNAGPNYRKLLALDPALAVKLGQVVLAHKIRVVHAHHFEGALCALAVKRLIGGIQVVYDAHTSLADELLDYAYPFFMPKWVKKVAASILDSAIPRWSDHVVAVSDSLKEFIVRSGVGASKVSVIPMAVNLGDFPVLDRHASRERLGLRDAPTVLYTGNLAPFQGVDHLLKSMRIVRSRREDVRLVIVGRPTPESRELAAELGIAADVHFAGEKSFDQVRDYLAAADVVVLPRERCPGFPLKLLNYMAAGRAIVAFRGSSREVLQHAVNGYVVPDGDEPAFAAGILHCLSDPGFSAAMGAAARRTADIYSEGEMDRRTSALYRSVLFSGAPGRLPPALLSAP